MEDLVAKLSAVQEEEEDLLRRETKLAEERKEAWKDALDHMRAEQRASQAEQEKLRERTHELTARCDALQQQLDTQAQRNELSERIEALHAREYRCAPPARDCGVGAAATPARCPQSARRHAADSALRPRPLAPPCRSKGGALGRNERVVAAPFGSDSRLGESTDMSTDESVKDSTIPPSTSTTTENHEGLLAYGF